MGAAMATLLILGLFLLIAAPALWAMLRRDVPSWVGAFYGVGAVALLAWHVGFGLGPMPDAASLARAPAGVPDGTRCEQALATAERGRIVLDRSNPDRLVVDDALWEQIPEELRAALTGCADSLRPADRRQEPVAVVGRGR